jgi:hypothetical protein
VLVGVTSTRRQGSGRARQERIKALPAALGKAYDGHMADLWVLVTVIGFFALCVGFVWGCDRIIGPDEAELLDESSAEVPGEVVAR